MKTKKERIALLLEYFADGKKARFSKMLGGSSELVGGWLKNDTLDVERVISHFPQVNEHWLRTGEGEMIKPDAKAGIQTAIADHNSTAYNVAGDAAEVFNLQKEIVRLQAENSILKNEVEFLRTLLKRRRNP